MAARASGSAMISFGLVSIPVKLYTAASAETVRFHMIDPDTGGRVKQQLVNPGSDKVVERRELLRGYEYARNQYVTFTDQELKALEGEKSQTLDIVEFVPLDTVDLVYAEKSYYLGPDKGGAKAYRLLSRAMARTGKVAVGRWHARGRDQLVVVRPYEDGGLLLHQVYYADEVRAFDEIDLGEPPAPRPGEDELADQLIAQLSTERFEPEKYRDTYRDRVMAAVEQKIAGQEITVAPEQPQAQIIDLFEALKASLGKGAAGGKAVAGEGADDDKAIKPPKKAATAAGTAAAKKKSPRTGKKASG